MFINEYINQGRIQDLFIGGVEISSEARDERSERRAKRETSEASKKQLGVRGAM